MFVVSVYSLFVGHCESHFVYPYNEESNARELFNKEVASFQHLFPEHELCFDTDCDDDTKIVNAHWESGSGDVFDMTLAECDYCDKNN